MKLHNESIALATVVSVREVSTDADAIHRGKEPTTNLSNLIHKSINQCKSLAVRKGLGEIIRQVRCCVLIRQTAHNSS